MDWTTIGLFAFLVLSYGTIGLAVYLVMREERQQGQIRRRFYDLIRRRSTKSFTCQRCHQACSYKPQRGEVCFNCWLELVQYLQEVA